MQRISTLTPIIGSIAILATTFQTVLNGATPEVVVDSYEERVEQLFRAESGHPLVRAPMRPPLSPERGKFARHYPCRLSISASVN
jgi:hypothetical protein